MAGQLLGTTVGALVCLATSPYLARLTASVPEAENKHWWRGAPASSARTVCAAAVAVVLGGLAGRAAGWTALLPAFVALALFCVPLVLIDVQLHRLPNRLVFPAAGTAVVLGVLAAALRSQWPQLLRGAEGAAAVFAVLFALWVVSPKSFGYGDVKLGAVLGGYLGWFGWLHVFYGVFAGFLLGALASIGLLATGRASLKTALPFGPALILGPLLVLAFDFVPHVR